MQPIQNQEALRLAAQLDKEVVAGGANPKTSAAAARLLREQAATIQRLSSLLDRAGIGAATDAAAKPGRPHTPAAIPRAALIADFCAKWPRSQRVTAAEILDWIISRPAIKTPRAEGLLGQSLAMSRPALHVSVASCAPSAGKATWTVLLRAPGSAEDFLQPAFPIYSGSDEAAARYFAADLLHALGQGQRPACTPAAPPGPRSSARPALPVQCDPGHIADAEQRRRDPTPSPLHLSKSARTAVAPPQRRPASAATREMAA